MKQSLLVSRESGSAPRSLTGDVKSTLLGWIREGKYPPASQLPSVPDLVERLEVSRTVVREALQALVGMNLVEVRPGVGFFVRSVRPELVVNADVMAALLDMDALIEVAKARQVIEAGVARAASQTATADDFDELEALLDRIGRIAKRNQPMHSLTPLFHVAIARATGNPVLEKVVQSFNSLMATAGSVIEREHIGVEYRVSEYESHRHLLEAIRSRDADRAQFEMEAHVRKTVDQLTAIRDAKIHLT